MYGANAFTGVINIITREAGDLVEDGRELGADARVTGGSFGTAVADATVAGKSKTGNFAYTVTARVFESDEFDLSDTEQWDYDPGVYETLAETYRDNLRFEPTAGQTLDDFLDATCTTDEGLDESCPDLIRSSPFFELTSEGGLKLSDEGLRRAIELDQAALRQEVGGRPVEFSNPTDAWLVHGKLTFANLILGFQTWQKTEGAANWYTDQLRPGGDNGQLWSPEQTWFYLKYQRPVGANLTLDIFSQYKEHTLNGNKTNFIGLRNYARGNRTVADLVRGRAPSWEPFYFYLFNTQLRSELKVVYSRSEKLDLVSGLEFRSSSVQGDYVSGPEPNPAETGSEPTTFPGGNRFSSRDVGLYAQASYRPRRDLKLVAGGRFDDNQVRETLGYGTVFNPRLAVVYSPDLFRRREEDGREERPALTFKAVYSEAFLDVPNFQKYATIAGERELPAPNLAPEKVENVELGAAFELGERFTADLVAYESRYSDVVQLVSGVACDGVSCPLGTTTSQFQAIGRARGPRPPGPRPVAARQSHPIRQLHLYRSDQHGLRVGVRRDRRAHR